MTHGVCGKEGAMVLKMLKGLGRLMLTTSILCGVGLFLCSSEVKAAGVPDTPNGDGKIYVKENTSDYEIFIDAAASTTYAISNHIIEKNGTVVPTGDFTATYTSVNNTSASASLELIAKVNKSVVDTAVLNKLDGAVIKTSDIDSDTGKIALAFKADVAVGAGSATTTPAENSLASKKLYKITTTKRDGYTTDVGTPTYTITFDNLPGRDHANGYFGYKNETYKVKSNVASTDYYEIATNNKATTPNWDAAGWSKAGEDFSFTVLDVSDADNENTVKFDYLPIIEKVELKLGSATYKTTDTIPVPVGASEKKKEIEYAVIATPKVVGTNNDKVVYEVMKTATLTDKSSNLKFGGADFTDTTRKIVKVTLGDGTAIFTSTGAASAKIEIGVPAKTGVAAQSFVFPMKIETAVATGFEYYSDVTVEPNSAVDSERVIKGITPAEASQILSDYDFKFTKGSTWSSVFTKLEFDPTTGYVTIQPKSGVKDKSVNATITMYEKGTTNVIATGTVTFSVKHTSYGFLDAEETEKAINNGRNYITYNKDKGYTLDIKQLVIDNAKDSDGEALDPKLTKEDIEDVVVGTKEIEDGKWKPDEAVINRKVTCTADGEPLEFKVSAYPMPTATYNSDHSVKVTIPEKVSTGLGDASSNLRQCTGFKLSLLDSSGNSIYDYTDSKYQNVVSSFSSGTASYTVSASDIEGMITSAASNGRFSGDTTSVKFRVIPMGYKQSNTKEKETIVTKDEVNGVTGSTTVYRVSASGAGFNDASTYGLDGQTVTLTATPKAGYTFKQWSDGNTSNPRQIKISSSGTRAFQAVAGEKVPGADNSELYDDVPKTAESNSAIWLIVFMVFAVMGTTYALYLQLKAASAKNDK